MLKEPTDTLENSHTRDKGEEHREKGDEIQSSHGAKAHDIPKAMSKKDELRPGTTVPTATKIPYHNELSQLLVKTSHSIWGKRPIQYMKKNPAVNGTV